MTGGLSFEQLSENEVVGIFFVRCASSDELGLLDFRDPNSSLWELVEMVRGRAAFHSPARVEATCGLRQPGSSHVSLFRETVRVGRRKLDCMPECIVRWYTLYD